MASNRFHTALDKLRFSRKKGQKDADVHGIIVSEAPRPRVLLESTPSPTTAPPAASFAAPPAHVSGRPSTSSSEHTRPSTSRSMSSYESHSRNTSATSQSSTSSTEERPQSSNSSQSLPTGLIAVHLASLPKKPSPLSMNPITMEAEPSPTFPQPERPRLSKMYSLPLLQTKSTPHLGGEVDNRTDAKRTSRRVSRRISVARPISFLPPLQLPGELMSGRFSFSRWSKPRTGRISVCTDISPVSDDGSLATLTSTISTDSTSPITPATATSSDTSPLQMVRRSPQANRLSTMRALDATQHPLPPIPMEYTSAHKRLAQSELKGDRIRSSSDPHTHASKASRPRIEGTRKNRSMSQLISSPTARGPSPRPALLRGHIPTSSKDLPKIALPVPHTRSQSNPPPRLRTRSASPSSSMRTRLATLETPRRNSIIREDYGREAAPLTSAPLRPPPPPPVPRRSIARGMSLGSSELCDRAESILRGDGDKSQLLPPPRSTVLTLPVSRFATTAGPLPVARSRDVSKELGSSRMAQARSSRVLVAAPSAPPTNTLRAPPGATSSSIAEYGLVAEAIARSSRIPELPSAAWTSTSTSTATSIVSARAMEEHSDEQVTLPNFPAPPSSPEARSLFFQQQSLEQAARWGSPLGGEQAERDVVANATDADIDMNKDTSADRDGDAYEDGDEDLDDDDDEDFTDLNTPHHHHHLSLTTMVPTLASSVPTTSTARVVRAERIVVQKISTTRGKAVQIAQTTTTATTSKRPGPFPARGRGGKDTLEGGAHDDKHEVMETEMERRRPQRVAVAAEVTPIEGLELFDFCIS